MYVYTDYIHINIPYMEALSLSKTQSFQQPTSTSVQKLIKCRSPPGPYLLETAGQKRRKASGSEFRASVGVPRG